MTLDAFLEQAWADHADQPDAVAKRLDEGFALIETPAQIAPFARILAHVDGEHLARWREGAARLERLRADPHWRDDGDGARIVRRLIASMRLGAGETLGPGVDAADRAHAHSVTSSAFVAQGRQADAIAQFDAACAAAETKLADGDPSIRALAVASNNLAAALEEKPARDGDETRAMLAAARASRENWARAGTWLEIERAECMLAKCHLAAGDPDAALGHAKICVAICDQNHADAFERFFAHAVLALACRATGQSERYAMERESALANQAMVAAGLRSWCEPTMRMLN